MTTHKHAELVTRENLMKLLSDDEIAKVSNAETKKALLEGDEYVDLEQLDGGVRRAPSAGTNMGHVLPRKAVHDATWSKILAALHTAPAKS